MLQSEETKDIVAAMVKAQANIKPAKFNAENTFFKKDGKPMRYANLLSVIDAVQPAYAEQGIVVTQTTEMREAGFCLVTTLRHTSGQWLASEYPLPMVAKPQELASNITYARRYSLSCIACIAADEDDDGNGAQQSGQVSAMKRDNPHVTQQADVNAYEARVNPSNGEPIDCIPVHLHRVEKLKVADARPIAETLLAAMRLCKTPGELVEFGEENAEQFASLPDKWIAIYQGEYQTLLDDLRRKQKRAA